jgi:hypothetical protein
MTYIGELRRTARGPEIPFIYIMIFLELKVISRKVGELFVVRGRPERVIADGTERM